MSERHDDQVSSRIATFITKAFDVEAVKKAAYVFSDRASFDIQPKELETVVRIDFAKPLNAAEADEFVAHFRNEVLDQDLRRSISAETAPLRNAILGYAFSRTGMQGG